MNEIEEVKDRINIEEVVSSYLTLKRAGANLKGLCPFHNEKTPSFMVNPERQIFKCFGCGEGGDIFTFIEKIEGVDFYNALKILADRAGVKLTSRSINRGKEQHQADLKTTLFEINEWANKVYHKLLTDHKKADKARSYLEERGLNTEIINKFQIGYAPDSWDFIIRFLESKGYKKIDIFKAGLLVKNAKGDYYDRFRGRIIFPINNVMGNCIGFTSRVLVDDGKQAKYINSAESDIYHKGKVLYGLDKAKILIRDNELAVVVEGNMDVIACHQAGFGNVVAASGTAITEEQIRILSRYTPNIAYAFDSDTAGLTAMKRAVLITLKNDITPKIVEIPYGFKDPDEAIRKDKKIWQLAVKNARPALEIWIDILCRERNINDISDRKHIIKEILPVIKNVSTDLEKEHYIKYLSKKILISMESLLNDMNKNKNQFPQTEKASANIKPLNIFQRIMAIIWSEKSLIKSEMLNLAIIEKPQDKESAEIWQHMITDKKSLEILDENQKKLLDQWSYQFSIDYQELNNEILNKELKYLLLRLRQSKNEDAKQHYSNQIKLAEESGDKEKMKKLLEDFSKLISE